MVHRDSVGSTFVGGLIYLSSDFILQRSAVHYGGGDSAFVLCCWVVLVVVALLGCVSGGCSKGDGAGDGHKWF